MNTKNDYVRRRIIQLWLGGLESKIISKALPVHRKTAKSILKDVMDKKIKELLQENDNVKDIDKTAFQRLSHDCSIDFIDRLHSKQKVNIRIEPPDNGFDLHVRILNLLIISYLEGCSLKFLNSIDDYGIEFLEALINRPLSSFSEGRYREPLPLIKPFIKNENIKPISTSITMLDSNNTRLIDLKWINPYY